MTRRQIISKLKRERHSADYIKSYLRGVDQVRERSRQKKATK